METLLKLQDLDLKIQALRAREKAIPKQKEKFDIRRERLAAELEEAEQNYRHLLLEQKQCESEIDEFQSHIEKYQQQLLLVKKNEEYQALLHEIEMLKKQVAAKEERIISAMVQADETKERLEEDKKRIDAELAKIDRECAAIDKELEDAGSERLALERQREPLIQEIDPELLDRYEKIRSRKKFGPTVVPLNDEVCTGCHMHVPAQIVNEVLAGEKIHACIHCGRLLYYKDNFQTEDQETSQ